MDSKYAQTRVDERQAIRVYLFALVLIMFSFLGFHGFSLFDELAHMVFIVLIGLLCVFNFVYLVVLLVFIVPVFQVSCYFESFVLLKKVLTCPIMTCNQCNPR